MPGRPSIGDLEKKEYIFSLETGRRLGADPVLSDWEIDPVDIERLRKLAKKSG